MHFNFPKGKSIFITGFQKNSGKTTALNYILKTNKNIKKGYFSINIDREKKDSIYGILKPQIYAQAGDIILSNSNSNFSDSLFKVINAYENGKILMLEILRPGYVDIGGVAGNYQIDNIIKDMKNRGCENIFIDGALDRITQISTDNNSCFIYVAKVEPENILSVIDKIHLIYSMIDIPINKENYQVFENINSDFLFMNDRVFIKGAITNSKIEKIPKNIKKLFIEDFTKVFLDFSNWKSLISNKEVFFVKKSDLIAFIINLYNISKEDFEHQLKNKEIKKFIIYNIYEHK